MAVRVNPGREDWQQNKKKSNEMKYQIADKAAHFSINNEIHWRVFVFWSNFTKAHFESICLSVCLDQYDITKRNEVGGPKSHIS
jgi:hypothetical protein